MAKNSTTRFSNRVEDYVKYRPGYSKEIISYLQDAYGLDKGKIIGLRGRLLSSSYIPMTDDPGYTHDH